MNVKIVNKSHCSMLV